jgi:hypothetical protein
MPSPSSPSRRRLAVPPWLRRPPPRPSLYGRPLPLFNLGYNHKLEPLFSPPPLFPAAGHYRVPRPGTPPLGPINRPRRSPSITAPSPLITLLSRASSRALSVAEAPPPSVAIASPLRCRPRFSEPYGGIAFVPSPHPTSTVSRSRRCAVCQQCAFAATVPHCFGPPWTRVHRQSTTHGPSP